VRLGIDRSDRGLCVIIEEESEALRLLAGATDDPAPGLDLVRLDRARRATAAARPVQAQAIDARPIDE
jgi:hypothetical protein